jgi:hypothetical protein
MLDATSAIQLSAVHKGRGPIGTQIDRHALEAIQRMEEEKNTHTATQADYTEGDGAVG